MSDLLPQIREICRLFEIKPSRSKGQNFLINERIGLLVDRCNYDPWNIPLGCNMHRNIKAATESVHCCINR